jgi:hypothetical protein
VDFKKATDQLIERITLVDIAEACGSAVNSIERARLEPDSRHHREPPPDWVTAIERLARERGEKLLKLANQLREN